MSLIDPILRAELSRAYGDPGRHYHGMAHVEALLGVAAVHRAAIADPAALEAAIWFHDAVYDSRRADNEQLSAELARDRLSGRVAPERLDRIAAMILATATHEPPRLAAPWLGDALIFLDMDLSILGAAPPAFDAYEQAVRREYGWVDESAWRSGRAGVLERFLKRGRIFRTPAFAGLEEPARGNLSRSLAALRAGAS